MNVKDCTLEILRRLADSRDLAALMCTRRLLDSHNLCYAIKDNDFRMGGGRPHVPRLIRDILVIADCVTIQVAVYKTMYEKAWKVAPNTTCRK